MKLKSYFFVVIVCASTILGCSKSKDEVKPDTASLLVRKWSFTDLSVKTDAKTYLIPSDEGTSFFGEDNTVTFNADNTYSTLEDGKTVKGTWKLSDDGRTLSVTDADKVTTPLVVNAISSSTLDLATNSVDMTKANPSMEEQMIAFMAGMLLYAIDKDYGGTVDFTKEPDPKSLQIVLKGKAI